MSVFVDFSFSDSVAGYLEAQTSTSLTLRGLTGDPLHLDVSPTASAQFLRNLGSEYADATPALREARLPNGSLLFAYGPLVPGSTGHRHKASSIVVVEPGEVAIRTPSWWQEQAAQIAAFYRRAQFGREKVDFRQYRTRLGLSGQKNNSSGVQETDTISRLMYGMASSYLLSGNEDHLAVARAGAQYMQDNLRVQDAEQDVTYWLHGLDVSDPTPRQLFTSEFGDDYHALPAYEQIYALCGLVQTYRVTGNPEILADIEGTIRLFERFYRDPGLGGYFSHIDPLTLSPHSSSLEHNRSRKNWNSVGDHAPAYLFNLYLATGRDRYLAMLEHTFDMVLRHFPDPDPTGAPFVRERFHADWSVDNQWGWQLNRAVVGHNLKIAWNLLRMYALSPSDRYLESATALGRRMPGVGLDARRGGWYDVLERDTDGQPQFVWHDRKTWWQQEQAVLAYLLLASHADPAFETQAFEAAAYYNAHFLDHDNGGVFFTTLASGLPFIHGDEGGKGSHAMSAYHSIELCFLAAAYTALYLRKEPLTLWFRPEGRHAFDGGLLRVAPDALPMGAVRLQKVHVDGAAYEHFDPRQLTVSLPRTTHDITVQVELAPSQETNQ